MSDPVRARAWRRLAATTTVPVGAQASPSWLSGRRPA